MRSTILRTCILGMATVALTGPLLVSSPGAAAPDRRDARDTGIHVRDLPRGPAPKVPWLGGNVLHEADGTKVAMPFTAAAARTKDLRLVGRAATGWVLTTDRHRVTRVWLVDAGGHREQLGRTVLFEGDLFTVSGVSDDGLRYFTTRVTTDGPFTTVRPIDGSDPDGIEADGTVLAFPGPTAVLDGLDEAELWDLGAGTFSGLGTYAEAASTSHDLLLARTDADSVGPTSLATPGTPAWTADMEDVVISPDGDRLVSRRAPDSRTLEVRDVADGTVLATYRFPDGDTGTPVWESDEAFVFVHYGRVHAIVRCRVSGRCNRASAFAPSTTHLSIPRRPEPVG